MTARDIDRAIEGLARRQHGAFHRRQALRKGATHGIIQRRVDAGTWIRLGGQVFVLPSSEGTWLRQGSAATLSVPGSAISDRAGLALHGVDGFPKARLQVVTRWGGTSRSPFADVRRTTEPIRAVVIDGLRVVRLSRCLAGLGTTFDAERLGDLVDDLRDTRRWLLGDIQDDWADLIAARRPGSAVLQEVVASRGEDAEPPASALASKLRRFLRDLPQLPAVVWEAPAEWIGPGRRVDAYIPEMGLVIEADGRAWHIRVEQFEEDRWRDALALAAGIKVVRLTWRRLVRDPAGCRSVLTAIHARWCRDARIP